MLVLTTRLHEKIRMPDQGTTIEVVSIGSGSVRIGIQAPEEVRILREGIPDRVAEWGLPEPEAGFDAVTGGMSEIKKLLDKRLEIARRGLSEAHKMLRDGQNEDARIILEKVDEDLHLLKRRLRREFDNAEMMACSV